MSNEEKALVEYQARDGQRIKLTPQIIKRYLVSGRSEFVTDQELFMYMGLCKSRGLNPFIKDCHLVKYTPNEGAAIITSIDYYRKRAKAQADCKGWTVGIVVQRNGELVYRKGCILLENEILVGGWAEGKPEGWAEPMRKEVNLKRYIKKTKDGNVTRFWSEDNQPEMIAKVAESQLLRTLWPDEFQGLYVDSEMQSRDAQDEFNTAVATPSTAAGEPEEDLVIFEDVFADEIKDTAFAPYLTECANLYKLTADQARAEFVKQPDQIKRLFADWKKKAAATAAAQAKASPATAPAAEVKPPASDPNQQAEVAPGPGNEPTFPPAGPADAPPKEKSFRDEWINLTGKGFGPYVNRNVERFKAADDALKLEAIAKWKKLYATYPCPIEIAQPEEAPKGEQQQIGDGATVDDPVMAELKAMTHDEHEKHIVFQAQKNLWVLASTSSPDRPRDIPGSAEGRSRLLDEVNRLKEEKRAQ